jgi:hypothetical protein
LRPGYRFKAIKKGQMMDFEESAGALVATAAKIARLKDLQPDADVLESSKASLIQTGGDENWGQSVEFYTLMLEVPITLYVGVDEIRTQLERRICDRLAELTRTAPGNRITEVVISPVMSDSLRQTSSDLSQTELEEEPPSFWQPGCFRLFISHTSANRESAHRLKEALAEYHVAAFVAHDDIEPTKEWEAEIERALRTTDALAAIITSDFIASRWCDQEVGFAFGRQKLVVPLCKDALPHGFLAKVQGCKTQGLTAVMVAEQVFNLLLGHNLTSQRMSDAIVDRMFTSRSFASTRQTMKLLERLPRLNEAQLTKLVQASESNSQVFNTEGISHRIQSLVARLGKSA